MKIEREISKVTDGLEFCIVIPAFCEPSIATTLESVRHCMAKSTVRGEVLVVLNQGVDSRQAVRDMHRKSWRELQALKREMSSLQIIWARNIPKKVAGVGTARKLGMDLVAERLRAAGAKDGIIACLDADCTLKSNYLQAVFDGFARRPAFEAASIYFEHPYGELSGPEKDAIVCYETHLRLFKIGQQWAGHPHAFHTVGSAMAVRAKAYEKQGGMNRRKAGEDFYFLHKFIEIGRCFELGSTAVYPSGRASGRVPFGTGKAVNDFLESGRQLSYHPRSYGLLKKVVGSVEALYEDSLFCEADPALVEWAETVELARQVDEIKNHSSNYDSFRKRFFRWFNAFRLMKLFHFLRNWHPDVPVDRACEAMMPHFGLHPTSETEKNLELLRTYEMRQMSHAFSS